VLIKKAPARVEPPGARHIRSKLMRKTSVLQDEVRRAILREAEERYRNELMDTDERELLWNRILRLKRLLKLA